MKEQEKISDKPYTNRTILIVEDVDTNFDLIKNLLSEKNAYILWGQNGKEAVELCKKHNVDLILMDIKMPVMNGLDATTAIRKFNQTVPIIAQTAYAFEFEKSKCIDAGCNDYISKPLKRAELISLLDKYM